MTPAQKAAVAAILNTDLSTLDSDRLIELCVIYRAAPDALDTFPAALKAELERRYSSEVIASEDVNFGVLQHMSNQFQSAIPYFHLKLLEMTGTINRDIWFTDHEALFRSAIDNDEVAAWLVAKAQEDILNKCLRNRIALGYLAQSQTTATAILANETACALWKNAPDLWQVWPQHRTGMAVVAKSAELTQYIIDTPAALAAVVASDNAMQPLIASATARRVWVDSEVAMTAVAASQTAMTAVAASQTTMTAVAASQTAMTAVAASQTAMTAVAGSEVAMRAVAGSEVAMRAVAGDEKFMRIVIASSVAMAAIAASETGKRILIAENQILQSHKDALYSMVKQHWTNARSIRLIDGQGGVRYESGNSALAEPNNALIFVCLGSFSTAFQYGRHQLEHPDGSVAALGGYRNQPSTMQAVDGVSFAGAKIKQTVQIGGSYAEVWIPKV
nr:MAG TPA: Tail fiber protein [Herelleviridae sp.]